MFKGVILTAMALLAMGARAADAPPAAVPATVAEVAPDARPAARAQGKRRALPRGDLRHCLAMKDNKAIIRCAESRR